MPTVDGAAAAATMQSWSTCEPGYCLKYVWNAYAAHGATSDRTFPTAYSAWEASTGRNSGRDAPLGVPQWLGVRPDSSAGDVVISLGGGLVVATDWPTWGVIGVCTLDQRIAQTGRPYLGWTDNILGNPIDWGQSGPGDDREGQPMFIAAIRGNVQLVLEQGSGKPRAVMLDGSSQMAASGIPVLYFTDQFSVEALAAAVDNIIPG